MPDSPGTRLVRPTALFQVAVESSAVSHGCQFGYYSIQLLQQLTSFIPGPLLLALPPRALSQPAQPRARQLEPALAAARAAAGAVVLERVLLAEVLLDVPLVADQLARRRVAPEAPRAARRTPPPVPRPRLRRRAAARRACHRGGVRRSPPLHFGRILRCESELHYIYIASPISASLSLSSLSLSRLSLSSLSRPNLWVLAQSPEIPNRSAVCQRAAHNL